MYRRPPKVHNDTSFFRYHVAIFEPGTNDSQILEDANEFLLRQPWDRYSQWKIERLLGHILWSSYKWLPGLDPDYWSCYLHFYPLPPVEGLRAVDSDKFGRSTNQRAYLDWREEEIKLATRHDPKGNHIKKCHPSFILALSTGMGLQPLRKRRVALCMIQVKPFPDDTFQAAVAIGQIIFHTLAAFDQCGTWLAIAFHGNKFVRLIIISDEVVAIESQVVSNVPMSMKRLLDIRDISKRYIWNLQIEPVTDPPTLDLPALSKFRDTIAQALRLADDTSIAKRLHWVPQPLSRLTNPILARNGLDEYVPDDDEQAEEMSHLRIGDKVAGQAESKIEILPVEEESQLDETMEDELRSLKIAEDQNQKGDKEEQVESEDGGSDGAGSEDTVMAEEEPGTGDELARLLKHMHRLSAVSVSTSEMDDLIDPAIRKKYPRASDSGRVTDKSLQYKPFEGYI